MYNLFMSKVRFICFFLNKMQFVLLWHHCLNDDIHLCNKVFLKQSHFLEEFNSIIQYVVLAGA